MKHLLIMGVLLLPFGLMSQTLPDTATRGYNQIWNTPDWSENAVIANERSNIYKLTPDEFKIYNRAGRIHALMYPVGPTGLLAPMRPFEEIANNNDNYLLVMIKKLFKITTNIGGIDDFFNWMGMKTYPISQLQGEGTGAYFVPVKNLDVLKYPMGITVYQKNNIEVATASCTACHAENLFGKRIIGMPNKTARANNVFVAGKKLLPHFSPSLFQMFSTATDAETKILTKLKNQFNHIGAKQPAVLGLDTSLATVALSFALREDDDYATISLNASENPRESVLSHLVADSKPMPWWNTKYKNRWLSDGSIISGNPIYTNILWNEIGRGADLHDLEKYFNSDKGKQTITELTEAVFAAEAPKYTDFFPAKKINLDMAKKGEQLFLATCTKCHGSYDKAWSLENADELSDIKKLETIKVNYPKQTIVKDVGTDPNRYIGMNYFAKNLNKLKISQTNGVKVVPQIGYVPPPLVGIWARWPYFHNGSAPTLCDVLTTPELRTKSYYTGPAANPKTDYDDACNGYPTGNKTPVSWKNSEQFYDTTKEGLSNSGHFAKKWTYEEKNELIMFLKTL